MRTITKIENLTSLSSLEAFLQGNQQMAFSVLGSKSERYHFIRKTRVKFSYLTLPKKDKSKAKRVYHINAVDEVTQFEIVCSVEKISEFYLMLALEQMLDSFPFAILGFHSDNGSEYINQNVAK